MAIKEEQGTRESIEALLDSWRQSAEAMADCFRTFYHSLAAMDGVRLQFTARPGVSYSLRPWRANPAGREFFAIVDVIDDDPGERWLSVCFYGDMISDPGQLGELIPGGLGGNDGYCFNLYDPDPEMVDYLGTRLREAYQAAGDGGDSRRE